MVLFILGNRKKSKKTMSGEYGSRDEITVVFLPKNYKQAVGFEMYHCLNRISLINFATIQEVFVGRRRRIIVGHWNTSRTTSFGASV